MRDRLTPCARTWRYDIREYHGPMRTLAASLAIFLFTGVVIVLAAVLMGMED